MNTFDEWKCPVCGTPLSLATDGKLHTAYQRGYGGITLRFTHAKKLDDDGKIRYYVPCLRDEDGAEGFICPETGDFICIRPAKENET